MKYLFNNVNKENSQTIVYIANGNSEYQDITIDEAMTKKTKITSFKARNSNEKNYLICGGKDMLDGDYELLAGNLASYIKKETSILLDNELTIEQITQFVTGLELGLYTFDKYKTQKAEIKLEEVIFGMSVNDDLLDAIMKGKKIAEATNFARTLVNEPASVLNPESYELIIKERYCNNSNVKITVYKGDDLIKEKMNGLIHVGKGSKYEPRLISLEFNNDNTKEKIAIVGKGLTFDTGGLNLKSGRYINMKTDMGGSAAALGAFDILVDLNAKVNVVCNLPICENMLSRDMQLDADVISYPNGVTVEVGNTDAEGRLVLADALLLSAKQNAKQIIDIATLTGAVVMALGNKIAGIFGNNQQMINDIIQSGKKHNEKHWHLPITNEYAESMESDHADIINTGINAPGAGACMAAWFLQKFVDQKIKWVHLDIAGTAYTKKLNYLTKATGFGARTMAEYILNQNK